MWYEVTQWVSQQSVTFKSNDVWQLCERRFAEITEWETVCRGLPNIEEQHSHTGELMEPEMETQVSSVSVSSNIPQKMN